MQCNQPLSCWIPCTISFARDWFEVIQRFDYLNKCIHHLCNNMVWLMIVFQTNLFPKYRSVTLFSPDKLYICPICNKEFKGSGRVRNCKIHINTVHLKHKPYKCNFCNVRFGYKDYMKRHLIRHHKSLFYSYGTESVLEKYTTYDLEEPSQQDHDNRHEARDQRDTSGLWILVVYSWAVCIMCCWS